MGNEEVVTYMNQIHEKSDWKTLLESWQVKDWYPFDETGDGSESSNTYTLYCWGRFRR